MAANPVQPGSKRCNICGGNDFVPGYANRMGLNGVGPTCSKCKSAERHRIVRAMYVSLAPLVRGYRVLQFAPDMSLPVEDFASFTGSTYGGLNSLDMMATGLADGSYDLVASNHVLEHVKDDRAAIRELLRVVGPRGVIHVNVPSPTFVARTVDWGFPDPAKTFHYRTYGADAGQLLAQAHQDVHVIAAIGWDDVTDTPDIVYWLSLDDALLYQFATRLVDSRIPVVKIR